jgi:hypothetical protein
MNKITAKAPIALFAVLLVTVSCSTGGFPPRHSLKSTVKTVAYQRGSRLRVFTPLVHAGVTVQINNGGVAGLDPVPAPAVITGSGYIVFIDEQPKYDWAHQCKVVFVTVGKKPSALLLFDEQMFGDLKIVDKTGKAVTGTWTSL